MSFKCSWKLALKLQYMCFNPYPDGASSSTFVAVSLRERGTWKPVGEAIELPSSEGRPIHIHIRYI